MFRWKALLFEWKAFWNVNWWRWRNFNANEWKRAGALTQMYVRVFASAELIWIRIDGCTCNCAAIICLWRVFKKFKPRAILCLHLFSLSLYSAHRRELKCGMAMNENHRNVYLALCMCLCVVSFNHSHSLATISIIFLLVKFEVCSVDVLDGAAHEWFVESECMYGENKQAFHLSLLNITSANESHCSK